MELADLALDHALPEHLQKPLGRLKRQGDKTGTESRSDDQRPVHLVRLQQLPPFFQYFPFSRNVVRPVLRDQPAAHALLHQGIHRSQGYVQLLRHLPLRDIRLLQHGPTYKSISIHPLVPSLLFNLSHFSKYMNIISRSIKNARGTKIPADILCRNRTAPSYRLKRRERNSNIFSKNVSSGCGRKKDGLLTLQVSFH